MQQYPHLPSFCLIDSVHLLGFHTSRYCFLTVMVLLASLAISCTCFFAIPDGYIFFCLFTWFRSNRQRISGDEQKHEESQLVTVLMIYKTNDRNIEWTPKCNLGLYLSWGCRKDGFGFYSVFYTLIPNCPDHVHNYHHVWQTNFAVFAYMHLFHFSKHTTLHYDQIFTLWSPLFK